MKSLNEHINENNPMKVLKETDLIELHKLGKKQGWKYFQQYTQLLTKLFGNKLPDDILDALQQIALPEDFAHYVLTNRYIKKGSFKMYKLDPKFDKAKLGF